jgi:hypothetical protein
VHPEQVAPAFLQHVNLALATGERPDATLAAFARVLNAREPQVGEDDAKLARGELLVCEWGESVPSPYVVKVEPGTSQRRRHHRKYAEGLLIPERSFYFRGPEGKLNLRAHNLVLFLEMADGVDPDTWSFHLQRGDYSHWFGEVIGDKELARVAQAVEADTALAPEESRARIREAVEQRYTQPENPSLPPLRAQ